MGVDMKGILGFMPWHEPQVPVRHELTSPLLCATAMREEFQVFGVTRRVWGSGQLPRKENLIAGGLLLWATVLHVCNVPNPHT